jgi:hypothetical protein
METQLDNFDKLTALVLSYRELKQHSDRMKSQMNAIKAEVKVLVEEQGAWQDSQGYARIVTRKGSVKYDSYALDILRQSMEEIDELISPYRRVTASSSYLQIK